jgi:hypothetical protein
MSSANDDNLLPEFWRFYAMVKGKKAPTLSALINFVQLRSREAGSTQVLPVISTLLFTNISSFELGASNVDVITQGVSPFLMCPIGSEKVAATTALCEPLCGEPPPIHIPSILHGDTRCEFLSGEPPTSLHGDHT